MKDSPVLKGALRKCDILREKTARGLRTATGPPSPGGGYITSTPAGQVSKKVRILRIEEDARN